jgi:hypothetical protein
MKKFRKFKTNTSAEFNLMDMLKRKGKVNKLRYVSSTLEKFGNIMNKIIKHNYNDETLVKYLLKLHFKQTNKNLKMSSLKKVERDHLKNVLKTRYRIKLKKHNISIF